MSPPKSSPLWPPIAAPSPSDPWRRRLVSRRTVLQSSALLALLSPVFRKRDAHGATAAPRRVILVFSPNGPINATGPATGTETAFTFHDWWKPLARHQADGIFLSNLASTGAQVVPGPQGKAEGHGLGGQCFAGFGTGSSNYISDGETIDQTIGKRLLAQGAAGVARSLAWGLETEDSYAFYSGPGRGIVPETDPQKAWASLFASFMPPTVDPQRAAQAIARQKSVLDFVSQDCLALKDALGAEGMRLLDDHCTTVRALEQNLSATLTSAGSCTRPADPGAKDWANPDNIDALSAAFVDLIAMTLACELSHVIAFQLAPSGARNRLAASYGVPSSPTADSGDSGPAHHPWTHQSSSQAGKAQALQIFTTFYASQVALLCDKLKATLDASGKPLFDSTVVLWLSELGGDEANGDPHVTGSQPAVLMGSGQGLFKTGRYLKGPSVGGNPGSADGGRMMAQLLIAVMQYMGLSDVNKVGLCDAVGPLAALYA
jgi:hypothetical protein